MTADSKCHKTRCRCLRTFETNSAQKGKEQLESMTDKLRIDDNEKLKTKYRETNIECDLNKWF
ncbi:hypothetical protein SAMN05444673_2565 [Bacillus sp. OV166]|nr:hypothetical protein SAMN05444673_2565 [Bacillus sp. OV166]